MLNITSATTEHRRFIDIPALNLYHNSNFDLSIIKSLDVKTCTIYYRPGSYNENHPHKMHQLTSVSEVILIKSAG